MLIDWLSLGLALVILAGYIATTLEFILGNRSIPTLSEVLLIEPEAHQNLPKVSIIIPARNEAPHIREALNSVLKLDYPNYELIVLNDRSDDETGAILDEMTQQHARLKVVHLKHLPTGWLGKNYALQQGADMAVGEFLLFTDADIVYEASALRRTVHLLQTRNLDHLAAMPEIVAHNLDLKVFVGAFGFFFSMFTKPWNAKRPQSKSYIGIGAFNLIRKTAYEAVGGHQAIAMRPDDDIKLGKLIKTSGFRQDLCNGADLIKVEWYTSLKQLVEGLMKNAFAGLDYNLPFTLGAVVAQFLFGTWPAIALFVTTGTVWWIYLIIMALMQLICLEHTIRYRLSPLTGPLFPVCTLLMIYIILRAATLTLLQNGIYWRGTYYPLSQLKANRI